MPSLKELALTQERLKHLLHYNPDTGVFTWVQRASKSVRVGNSAGSKNKSGYIDIRIDKSLHKAHRLAWLYIYGVCPNGKIDHINNVKTGATGLGNGLNRTISSFIIAVSRSIIAISTMVS
jgi:hypothetical protein